MSESRTPTSIHFMKGSSHGLFENQRRRFDARYLRCFGRTIPNPPRPPSSSSGVATDCGSDAAARDSGRKDGHTERTKRPICANALERSEGRRPNRARKSVHSGVISSSLSQPMRRTGSVSLVSMPSRRSAVAIRSAAFLLSMRQDSGAPFPPSSTTSRPFTLSSSSSAWISTSGMRPMPQSQGPTGARICRRHSADSSAVAGRSSPLGICTNT